MFGNCTYKNATGESDGTFRLATYEDGRGAVIGRNKVQIRCNESDAPGAAPPTEGVDDKSLIPMKYADLATSGIEVEVKETNEPFVFELTD